MIKGFKNPVTEKDLWDLNDYDKSDVLGEKFSHEWQKEMRKSRLEITRNFFDCMFRI